MKYSIGEFSRLTGLGVHTLRYYEHEGLLTPERDTGNRRRYCEKDLTWVEFIKRLKDTSMPIREIQRYARLRAAGDDTLRERLELLSRHKDTLAQQMELLRGHMERLNDKIKFYRREIERTTRDN